MTLDQIERRLERLRSRLYRTVNAIYSLEKAQRRIKKRLALIPVVPVKNGVAIIPTEQFSQTVAVPLKDDCGIPTFLQRQPSKADEAAKAEIIAQQEVAKASKTKARIAKLKADKAGDRKKMPLQGKDALKAIHSDRGR